MTPQTDPGHPRLRPLRGAFTALVTPFTTDRSPYVAGALAAADWLRRGPRSPGIHAFDEVVDDLLATGDGSPKKRRAVAGVAG